MGFHEAGQAAKIVLWVRTVNRMARKLTALIFPPEKNKFIKAPAVFG